MPTQSIHLCKICVFYHFVIFVWNYESDCVKDQHILKHTNMFMKTLYSLPDSSQKMLCPAAPEWSHVYLKRKANIQNNLITIKKNNRTSEHIVYHRVHASHLVLIHKKTLGSRRRHHWLRSQQFGRLHQVVQLPHVQKVGIQEVKRIVGPTAPTNAQRSFGAGGRRLHRETEHGRVPQVFLFGRGDFFQRAGLE